MGAYEIKESKVMKAPVKWVIQSQASNITLYERNQIFRSFDKDLYQNDQKPKDQLYS